MQACNGYSLICIPLYDTLGNFSSLLFKPCINSILMSMKLFL